MRTTEDWVAELLNKKGLTPLQVILETCRSPRISVAEVTAALVKLTGRDAWNEPRKDSDIAGLINYMRPEDLYVWRETREKMAPTFLEVFTIMGYTPEAVEKECAIYSARGIEVPANQPRYNFSGEQR